METFSIMKKLESQLEKKDLIFANKKEDGLDKMKDQDID
jgi:hypothetical protein